MCDLSVPYITALNNPISMALQRVTGRMWYVFDGHSVCCTREPLRAIGLPPKVSRWWQEFQTTGNTSLLDFELAWEA
ncbi:MAG TPA: hypothetical protein VM821_02745 [Abditibacteriaceae bacterium]|nr:hypothetical protein [Abditibacteriaceae bacterium]